jgi:hypothetical protein
MELKEYWAKNPPLHMMVKEEQGNLADLMAMAPQTPGA